MRRRTFMLTVMLLDSLTVSVLVASVSGWSNGGFSDDPSNPKYGTHDWVAQHALDWLPVEEKQFIINDIVSYLYGTELPDNGQAPDGIGDTTRHHVYYFANGSLQDDASAIRAQEEYENAIGFFRVSDLASAAKSLGVVTHYICDMAVFAHVMGSKTDWKAETHHSDYETYVDERTDRYGDEFNNFLAFDGSLGNVSAYNASLTLAYDTTFDADGDLTCVWMDQNYNWDNAAFKDRCGESLNLAVNLIADVIHTFHQDALEHHIYVPFHYQEKQYYCGPAALQMVFDFYGEDASQLEIADVARTVPVVTYTDELLRAAHFSNLSTSMGSEMPQSIAGYASRKLGYAAFERQGMTLEDLKGLIDHGFPIILLMTWVPGELYGHYRVAVGYNETHVILHDPWNNAAWGGDLGGPNLALNYSLFDVMWNYFDHWGLLVSPWKTALALPKLVYVGDPFTVTANVSYPCPAPFSLYEYEASSCNTTIFLPQGLSLALGENATKNLGNLQAGTTVQTAWTIAGEAAGDLSIGVEAEGIVSGSVGGKLDTGPSYDYQDRIGSYASDLVTVEADENPPEIAAPTQEPPRDMVMPYQNVTVSISITDTESGVKNVTLYCNLGDSANWVAAPMNYDLTLLLFQTTISGQAEGTMVRFKIVAFDYSGNNATRDGAEQCCTYQVIPEFPVSLTIYLHALLALPTILYAKKRETKKHRDTI